MGYGQDEKRKNLDFGPQWKIKPSVTIGNSSTATTVHDSGSNARRYYVSARGMDFLYRQYRSSNLYIYPEHRDHDPGHNKDPGYGDIFPTNSPYLIISQGSSGSDRPFLRTFLYTLAAFSPKVKQKLVRTGLLMPTMQMILRTAHRKVRQPDDYLQGFVHPSAFSWYQFNSVRMVEMAHEMTEDTIPPLVQLKVVEEDFGPRQEAINTQTPPDIPDERLADTPSVIARLWRALPYHRRLVVSTESSFDVNQLPLQFHWVVLRGDALAIDIQTSKDGAVAEILVPYHPRQPVAQDTALESNRVDIGVFAHNGTYYSAPAFVTFYSFDNELRTYDDAGRLLEIYYDAEQPTYKIANWARLFDRVQSPGNGFPGQWMRNQFNEPDRAALARVAADYRIAVTQLAIAETEFNRAKASYDQLKKLRLRSPRVSPRTPADNSSRPGSRRTTPVDPYLESIRTANRTLNEARKKHQAARATVERVLNTVRPELGGLSARQRMHKELDDIQKNVGFYRDNAEGVNTWLKQVLTRKEMARFVSARLSLAKQDILVQTGPNQFVLKSARAGPRPVEERLTGYEQLQIERFHLGLMSDYMFHDCIEGRAPKNYVDRRLTTPKPWRDVFHYDEQGKLEERKRLEVN